jgi:hypothetical protein
MEDEPSVIKVLERQTAQLERDTARMHRYLRTHTREQMERRQERAWRLSRVVRWVTLVGLLAIVGAFGVFVWLPILSLILPAIYVGSGLAGWVAEEFFERMTF